MITVPQSPWLVLQSIEWLEKNLDRAFSVLETGCGGSTFWFASRVGRVHSLEHQEEWATATRDAITKNIPGANVIIQLRELTVEQYIGAIENLEDNSFDLALVDGRKRVRSILAAMPKVKPSGYLLLDDSDRPWYSRGKDALADWDLIFNESNGKRSTSCWQKTE